jgi:hypothetical protein
MPLYFAYRSEWLDQEFGPRIQNTFIVDFCLQDIFLAGFVAVAQAVLPQPSECWGDRCVTPFCLLSHRVCDVHNARQENVCHG